MPHFFTHKNGLSRTVMLTVLTTSLWSAAETSWEARFCQSELGSLRHRSLAKIEQGLTTLRARPEGMSLDDRLEKSRLLYWKSHYTDDREAKKAMLDEAQEITEAARGTSPDNPGALIGYAAATGDLARLVGPFKALSYVAHIEQALLRLQKVNASYAHFAADRGLGMLYSEAPSIISVGSSRKARAGLESAMRGEGDYPGNQIAYALFLYDHDERVRAVELAKKVLRSVTDPKNVVEGYDWARQACGLLGYGPH